MPSDKPNQVYPGYPTNAPSGMPLFTPDHSIAGHSFDDMLKNRGVRFVHERATPCPNMLREDNNAHEPNCTFCDNNGFLHYGSREIWGVFSGNSIQKTFEAHGVWEIGTAVITFPTEYPDGTPADSSFRIIAADRNHWRMGTQVRLFFPDGDAATYTVRDTGGAIKGRCRFDMLVRTEKFALKWGRKKIRFEVVKSP